MVIRVVVVDDHDLVRRGVQQHLDSSADVLVVGSAADGLEALEVVREHEPDVVVMDLSMPRMDGLTATRQIKDHHPEVQVMVLTTLGGPDQIRAALEAGAVGYHLKDSDPAHLLTAVRATSQGLTTIDPRAAAP